MANIRLTSPLARMMLRNIPAWEEDEGWPMMTMTEGLDVYEEEDKIIVKASVPGVNPENVDIEFEDGVLRIRAHQEDTEEQKKKKKIVYRQDRVVSFDYTTTLPRPVDPKSIDADVEDGVVRITAKVAEEAKPKKIPVKASKKE